MGDAAQIATRFLNAKSQPGELELCLEAEVWDDVTDQRGNTIKNEEVEWHVYYARASVADATGTRRYAREELGRTLYSKRDNAPHKTYSPQGDSPTVINTYLLLRHLVNRGANAVVMTDTSGLFEEVGTLAGMRIDEAERVAESRVFSLQDKCGHYSLPQHIPAN
jgi:hypothetical protein